MSIWQTKAWQEMLKKSGQVEKTIEFQNIFIEKRKIGLSEFGLFVLGINFENLNENILKELKNICKKEKSLFLQLESYTLPLTHLSPKERGDYYLQTHNFQKKYYKKFITPYTAIIDLKKSEEEILAEMKPKGRYNIRLAEKKGVKVSEFPKTEQNIKIFYDLMMQTTSRDNFFGNTLNYYKIFLKSIESSKLLFAEYEGNIIAAGIFTYEQKIAIYYYGASTSDKNFRNLMAPYLLQWEAIKIGKNLGCEIYDFLGIAGEGEENSSLAGVTDFKLKFTKSGIKVSESLIFVNKKLKYLFINILRKIRK
ncbi:hypothetical protein DLH72_02655 [Candidatus Gracilibacteria bacterium]|nr:MAG: hypothetical protein DLH72_02655 [Candidatus Gracilibacteria bacterium]